MTRVALYLRVSTDAQAERYGLAAQDWALKKRAQERGYSLVPSSRWKSANCVLYPNGRVERSFRTDEEAFYQVEELPADLGGLEAALLRWNQVYETVRPHQALGYKTPEQFYQEWLTTHPAGKEVLSDIS